MNSPLGKLLRWIVFLPITFAALGILEALGAIAVHYSTSVRLHDVSFLVIVLAVMVAMFGVTLLYGFFVLVFAGAATLCGKFAPNARVGSVMFLTLFVLSESTFLLRIWAELSGFEAAFHMLYSIAVLVGGVAGYSAYESK